MENKKLLQVVTGVKNDTVHMLTQVDQLQSTHLFVVLVNDKDSYHIFNLVTKLRINWSSHKTNKQSPLHWDNEICHRWGG